MTRDEIEQIAELAADKAVEKALQKMYVEIGRGVLKKASYIVGVGIIALGVWLSGHGFK